MNNVIHSFGEPFERSVVNSLIYYRQIGYSPHIYRQ